MSMDIVQILTLLAIGAVAGWLAGILVEGVGFGLIGNIVVGIVGAFIGSFVGGMLSPALGMTHINELLGAIIWATIGAVILLLVIGVVRRAT